MKNYNTLLRILSITICIVLVACVAATSLMFVFGVKADIYVLPSRDKDQSTPARLGTTFDYGDSYIYQMLFFCDSVMAGITEFDIINNENDVITGKRGDLPLDFNISTTEVNKKDLDGKTQSIIDLVKLQKPRYLLISVGINNGVEHCAEEKFKQYYTKLVEAIRAESPQTHIILQSVFPVSKQASKSNPSRSNEKIDAANVWIEELCVSLSLRYLNTAEILKNDKGALDPTFDSGDGIRLNEKGYRAVIAYIKTHGYK